MRTSAPVTLPADDAILSKNQLIELFDICSRTLYRWELAGIGPKRVKLGRQVVYRGAAIREWLSERERVSNSPTPLKPVRRVPGTSPSGRRASRMINHRRKTA